MKERNAGLDALRCLSMMMIVMLHVLLHGGALRAADLTSLSFSTALLWILEMGSVCAVNCFGMLSGYLGVGRRVRVSSMLKLWLQVAFYAAGIYLGWAIVRMNPAKMEGWTQGLHPVTSNMYWYYTSYACLCFFVPMLNQLLESAKRTQLRRTLALLLAVICAERLFFDSDIFGLDEGYSMLWLAVLYLMGGYFRLYGGQSRGYRWLQKHGLWVYGALAGAVGLYWWARTSGRFAFMGAAERWARITAYDNMTAVALAVCLFAACSVWQPKGWLKKATAFCAPAAFSVYLIHTHPVFWNEILANRMSGYSSYPPFKMLLCVAAAVAVIFTACILVERIRMKAFAMLKIHTACDALGGWAERTFSRILGE
ncbi:MAG: acyltransferase [Clostridia bacterium]|nr:acyltransferase [Clostridia bacterium]